MKRIALVLFVALVALLVSCGTPEVAVQHEPIQPATVPDAPSVHVGATGWEGEPTPPEPVPLAFRPVPPGFPAADRYSSHDEACLAVVNELVPESRPGWIRPILLWCEHRSYHASRNTTVVSKVDGSQIHDRDRPTAWVFYELGISKDWLQPDCPFHQINRKVRHPRGCRKLADNWPFRRPAMTERMRNQWLRHPHEMEKFGARGPHDWNANAFRYIPGCWDPAQLDRFDVGISATVLHAMQICADHGCPSKAEIKAHW